MEHFSQEEWVDLARALLSPAKTASMQAHLEKGCAECRESSAIWKLISELCSREAKYQLAEGVLRTVKAAYPAENCWTWFTQIAESARLVFDSFRQSPAMVRSVASNTRHLVHEAEPYVIDIRLEPDPQLGQRTFLIGQILSSESRDELSKIDIVLLSGGRLVSKTTANASGEFELEIGREENMQLFINIRGDRAIGISLPELQA